MDIDSPGKKRPRKGVPADDAADKKMKKGPTNGDSASASRASKTVAATKSNSDSTTSSNGWSFGFGSSSAPAPSKYSTPANGKKKKEGEETPFMTAKSSPAATKAGTTSASETKESKKQQTVLSPMSAKKLSNKLDSIKENESESVKIVYKKGSYFFTTLVFFLCVTSCALLGGRLLHERLQHDLEVFALRQHIFHATAQGPPAVPESELEKMVQKSTEEAAVAQAKLAGYEKEVQDIFGKLRLS